MKILTLSVILLSLVITNCTSCPLKSYEEKGNCMPCHFACTYCVNSSACLLCNGGFLLFNGICYPECVPPRYPFLLSPTMFSCNVIEKRTFQGNNIIIKDYDSNEGVKSMYIEHPKKTFGIEMSFWIRFDDFGESSEEKNFFILTSSFLPHQIVNNFPYIFKLGFINDRLNGPTELLTIDLQMKIDRWYMITLTFDRDSESILKLFFGIIVYDFSNGDNFVASKSESYFSNVLKQDLSVLHLGNFLDSSNMIFQVRNLQMMPQLHLKFLGKPMYSISLEKFYDYEHNISSDVYKVIEKNGYVSLDFNVEDDFRIYAISLYLNIETSVFPATFFRILRENIAVYSLEMILKDDIIWLKRGSNFELKNWDKLHLNIFLIRIKDTILLYDSLNFIQIDPTPALTLEFHSSIFSTKFKKFKLIISKDPSLTNAISHDDNIPNMLPYKISKGILNPRFAFALVNKTCENDPSLNFLYSYKDCELDFRYACNKANTLCDICLNESFCIKCHKNAFMINGLCEESPSKSLSCFYDEIIDSNRCEECSHDAQYFIDDNGICTQCNSSFLACLLQDSLKNCGEIFLSKNCTIYSNEICPTNCNSCKADKESIICLSCTQNFKIGSENKCNACPIGLRYKDGECKFCTVDEVIKNKKQCSTCHDPKSIYKLDVCEYPCNHYMLFLNDTCKEIEFISGCINNGPRWCEFCSEDYNSYECRFQYHITYLLVERQSNNMMYELFILEDEIFECPKNFGIDEKISTTCAKKNAEDKIAKQENSPPAKVQNISRFCPMYLEGFFIITINDTCLYSPNTHYSTYDRLYILKSIIRTKKNMKIDSIKLTQERKSFGKIIDQTLFLERCPYRFYESLDGSCLFCGHDCLICTGPEPSNCLLKKEYDSNHIKTHFIDKTYYFLDVDHTNYDFKPVSSYNSKCPDTCKSCYYTGKKTVCLECHDPEHMTENCYCTFGGYFDTSNLKCVDKCSQNMKYYDMKCYSNCEEGNNERSSPLFVDIELRWCIPICYKGKALLNFETHEIDACTRNEFEEKLSVYLIDDKIITQNDLLGILWSQGLSQIFFLENANILSKFIHSFERLEYKSPIFQNKFIQLLTIMLKLDINIESAFLLLGLVDKIFLWNSTMNVLLKTHYLYQTALPYYIEHYNSKIFESTRLNASKTSSFSLKIFNDIEVIFEGLSSESHFYFVKSREISRNVLSFKVSLVNSSFNDKIVLYFIGANPNYTNLYLANYTSEFMELIGLGEKIEIFHSCIYFVMSSENFSNDSFYAMIEEDLFYGLDNFYEKDDEIENKDPKESSSNFLSIGIIFSFILIVFCMIFNRKPKKQSIHFVQMVNVDLDREESDLEDETRSTDE